MTETPSGMFEGLSRDIARWRSQIDSVTPTHCQGIGNKAANRYEGLLKTVAQHYVASVDVRLHDLLDEVGYKGNAKEIGKLPQGVLIESLRALAKRRQEVASFSGPVEEGARRIVEIRNEISHEDTGDAVRSKVSELLDEIDAVLARKEFWRPSLDD